MKINYTKELEEGVIKDYSDGIMTKKEIRSKYKLWGSQFCYILKKNSIPLINRRAIDSPTKKYFYDTDFFKKIDTEEKAYFLGLLMADGYVSNRPQSRVLGLTMTDEDCIIKFQKALKTNAKITVKQANTKNGVSRKTSWTLLINSKEIVEDLHKLGVVGKKTYRTYIPNIDSGLIKHFIRGYFDGDGCIYVRKNTKSCQCSPSITSSSVLIIKQIQSFLQEVGLISKTKNYINSPKPTYQTIIIDNKIEGLKFLEYIYKDSVVYMDRKYNKYLEIINKPMKVKNDNCSSKYFGVSVRKKEYGYNKRYTSRIQERQIGNFSTEIEAAIAYNLEATKLGYPEWKLNKIEPDPIISP